MSIPRSGGRTQGWRFALSSRWAGYLAFAIVFAIACGFLSAWQVARSKEASAANQLVSRNFHAAPAPVGALLPTLTSWRDSEEWRKVELTGTYLRSRELLARNRPTDDGPGFEILTPLRLTDGRVFVVDRGWVPTGNTHDAPDAVPAAPAGTVHVVARLKESEPTLPDRSATGDQIATIHLPTIDRRVGGDVYTGAYGLLVSQSPAPATAPTRVDAVPPVANEGLHWSYAIQWVIFALIGFFGLAYALVKEYRLRNEDDPEEQRRAEERARRRAAKRTDADIEDELVAAGARR